MPLQALILPLLDLMNLHLSTRSLTPDTCGPCAGAQGQLSTVPLAPHTEPVMKNIDLRPAQYSSLSGLQLLVVLLKGISQVLQPLGKALAAL